MFYLYNILVYISFFVLKVIALFNPKIRLFVKGRKESFAIVQQHILSSDKVFWIHVASLGEYEQGLPLIEILKSKFPNHKIVLTFFSPSGYEVKKNNSIADATLYLPMDTIGNAKRFINLIHPEKVFFVKYEYWPNYLNILYKKRIPTYLISGIFRPDQVFFKWYGSFYRKTLRAFTYYFVQNDTSAMLLSKLGFSNIEIVGDTRFDRVSQILENNNQLDFLDDFTNHKQNPVIVVGSSWTEDEVLLADYINNSTKNTKFVIAPHNIKKEQIDNLKKNLKKKTLLYSDRESKNLNEYTVLIIDAYSLLTKAYSYADIAYIGGGFGSGVHNILEAATYGIPVIIGPNYKKFQEAKDLISLGGCTVIHNQQELNAVLDNFLEDSNKRITIGKICSNFILKNKNATEKIFTRIFNLHK